MKKAVKISLLILAVIIAGGVIYWQLNKKRIVKNAIENVMAKKTGDLYFIHYDSSSIDAINGSASFYRLRLQSDSLERQLLKFDSASSPVIYNVHVGEVSISGANIPALIANDRVDAGTITIIRPVIYVIRSGTEKKKTFTYADTLAIYEKLLGKFKSIKADAIIIKEGQIHFSEKTEQPNISLNNINVSLKNVLIDSSKNYDNILSYFIKDVKATVKEIMIRDTVNQSTLRFSDFEYNASGKFIKLSNFQQKENEGGRLLFDINDTEIKGLNTDSFILIKQLKADELISAGGLMTFYRKSAGKDTAEGIELDNNFFNDALLNKITLGKTKVFVYDRKKPKDAPFMLDNVRFTVSEIQNLYSGTNISNLLSRSNWILSADGFSFMSADKIYKISVGAFDISKVSGIMNIGHFSVIPQVTGSAFVKGIKVQKDLYDMVIKNISISGIDTRKLLSDKILLAKTVTLQPVIKIFNDRTVKPDTSSKVGKAPQQLFLKMKLPVYVKKMILKNGLIAYTERGAASMQKGNVFFSNLNGSIENLTNIKDSISKNNLMTFNLSCRFLGAAALQSKWTFPLNSTKGEFKVTGNLGSFNAAVLNSITEPLALASIKKGQIKGLNFNIYGTDLRADGITTLLYNDLSVQALKKNSDDLKKRGLLSFFANLILKDDNPKNNITRQGEIDLERDKTRSFFNLLWKGVFSGVKRIAIGKDDGK